jgi:heterotetrameric sarcosine oxidase delta subunit
MLRIACPHCGPRDEAEFRYRGDASQARPAADAGEGAFAAYVYERANPNGWHLEWWLHAAGCRQVLKVLRHTGTHAIAAVGSPGDELAPPAADAPA